MPYWLFAIQGELEDSQNDSSISDCSYSKHETLCPRVWNQSLHCLGDSDPFNRGCRSQRIPSSKEYSVLGVEAAFHYLLKFFFEK